ncbi:hypothetical protein BGX34_010246 [Mortierella sp. NVP85]|nr:hypothetical protein BGX34_010246 [Mortierella sp. NVP85]
MASLIAALGSVEHPLEFLMPSCQAFFRQRGSLPQGVAPHYSTDHSAGRNPILSASTLAERSKVSRRAPSIKKSRSTRDSAYNCTNVYPHVETTETFYYDDSDQGDEVNLLRGMCADDMMWSNRGSSEEDDGSSGSEYDSDDSGFGSSLSDDEVLIEFGRKPRVFEDTATMTFYISPLAITQLAVGLWTRSRPACVIINTSIPRLTRFDDMDWSADALRMLNTPNAGGSSLLSEVLSCEMLNRCLGATLAKTEMEIRYLFAYQPITDYTITLPNLSPRMHVGVSVTRAFAFKGAYRKADCQKLLWKKLSGILASTRNVVDERFFKQILHVWVPNGKVARTVQATYKSLPIEVTRNTVVIISVVNAPWVFSNRR